LFIFQGDAEKAYWKYVFLRGRFILRV